MNTDSLQTFARLERAITLYSIIAWHILWLTYEVRVDPKQSCAVAFDPEEIRMLAALREQPAAPQGAGFRARSAALSSGAFMMLCGRWPNSEDLSAGKVMENLVSRIYGAAIDDGQCSCGAPNWLPKNSKKLGFE